MERPLGSGLSTSVSPYTWTSRWRGRTAQLERLGREQKKLESKKEWLDSEQVILDSKPWWLDSV
jgi:hypothetical protein